MIGIQEQLKIPSLSLLLFHSQVTFFSSHSHVDKDIKLVEQASSGKQDVKIEDERLLNPYYDEKTIDWIEKRYSIYINCLTANRENKRRIVGAVLSILLHAGVLRLSKAREIS